jgi:hypothetical protein
VGGGGNTATKLFYVDEGNFLGGWVESLVDRLILLEEELISSLCELIYLEVELYHLDGGYLLTVLNIPSSGSAILITVITQLFYSTLYCCIQLHIQAFS